MLKRLLLATVLTAASAGIAAAAPIVGSFSLGLSSGSYVGPANATAMTATGLDFGVVGGGGAGNGYGTNGSAVVYNAMGSFSALNNTTASVADISLGAGNIANPYNTNPFITLGSYIVSFTNASYTRSPLGTSVTITGAASFSDGVPADATTGMFSLSTSSQGGVASSVQFTFTSNVSSAANTVPEPMTLSILGAGLAAVGVVRRRRRS